MTPEMRHALEAVEIIESLAISIPPESRNAVLTAIMSGVYQGGINTDTPVQSAELRSEGDTVIAAEEEILPRPSFGL